MKRHKKLTLLVCAFLLGCELSHDIPFDSAAWKSWDIASGSTIRERMLNDFVEKNYKKGVTTMTSIISLLGNGNHSANPDRLLYHIGTEGIELIYCEFLILSDGTVEYLGVKKTS